MNILTSCPKHSIFVSSCTYNTVYVFSPARCAEASPITSVVHPDPAGSEIIYKLGPGSVINSGSDSGSKLSSASNYQIQSCKNVQIFKKLAFSQCLHDLQFK
jgi:hypothetical protein